MNQTITITKEEYKRLKRKDELTDDLIEQLKKSVEDIKFGRIKEWK